MRVRGVKADKARFNLSECAVGRLAVSLPGMETRFRICEIDIG
jgi:hypothetical protein